MALKKEVRSLSVTWSGASSMDGDINEAWVTEADVTVTGAVCYSRILCLPPASSHKASGA